jgi:RNA polymerase sigma-70 factor (ECF subfamily)
MARVATGELGEALSTLPEPMRDAVVLFHVSGLSYEEIATTLAVPKGTVMTWLHRGRNRLREHLEARSR